MKITPLRKSLNDDLAIMKNCVNGKLGFNQENQ